MFLGAWAASGCGNRREVAQTVAEHRPHSRPGTSVDVADLVAPVALHPPQAGVDVLEPHVAEHLAAEDAGGVPLEQLRR